MSFARYAGFPRSNSLSSTQTERASAALSRYDSVATRVATLGALSLCALLNSIRASTEMRQAVRSTRGRRHVDRRHSRRRDVLSSRASENARQRCTLTRRLIECDPSRSVRATIN